MKNLIHIIKSIQLAVGGIFLTIFLVTVIIQIFSRYLEIPVIWTEDVAMYSFIWSIFMGASAMVYEKQHFSFTTLQDKLNGNKKFILQIVISITTLVFTVLMFYYGVLIVDKFWNYRWISIPSFKMGYVWLCIPITGATSSIYLISQIFDDILNIFKKEVI